MNKLIRIPIILSLILLFVSLNTMEAQTKTSVRYTNSSGNTIENYTGSDEDLLSVIQNNTSMDLTMAISNLRGLYQEKYLDVISQQEVRDLLQVNSTNLSTWLAVYDQVKKTRTKEELFVLRSIIANIKKSL